MQIILYNLDILIANIQCPILINDNQIHQKQRTSKIIVIYLLYLYFLDSIHNTYKTLVIFRD